MTYDNPGDFGLDTVDMEVEALKNALAIATATDRLLILPSFRCCSRNCRSTDHSQLGFPVVVNVNIGHSNDSQRSTSFECSDPRHRCSLLSVLRLSKFDRVFAGRYREHSFLSNKLVPDTVKHAISGSPILINSSDARVPSSSAIGANVSHVTLTPANRSRGATLSEVVRWLDDRRNETVVRFHSLYGAAVDWASDKSPLGFRLVRSFQLAFECCDYGQWEADLLNLAKTWPGNKIK